MSRFIPSWPWLAAAFGTALLVLALCVAAKLLGKASFEELTRDLSAVAGLHPLAGILSQLGLMVWSGAATICFLAAIFLYRAGETGAGFFFSGGLLTTGLLLDDAFMFHEALAEWYLGIDEKLVYIGLALVTLTWLCAYRRLLLAVGPFFLLAALAMFAGSIGIDLMPEDKPPLLHLGDWRSILEDGAKWVGIVLWLTFQLQASLAFIEKSPRLEGSRSASKPKFPA
ncbi:hypothetical protein [Hyphomonas sp.]|uniref:hypothetical protein n=1 Tax=Hyphomonas sp. TaxID=87 RepID=UPI0025C0AFAF|nr:hypothetical protein [Hyphomonas sp.]